MKTMLVLGLLVAGLTVQAAENSDRCSVCGGRMDRVVYLLADKVAGGKRAVCEKCSTLTTVCYLCGLPVKEKYDELSDGRILCARDVKNVVLDEAEAQRIWQDTKDTVERLLLRFMTFPENVTVHPLDRVDLQQIFKVVGNDFICPNVWGCTLRETNGGNRVNYKISLLRGLPPSVLRATCAHELTHTWIKENSSRARQQRISQDAEEGFCELIACLYCEAQGDQAQLGVIRSNAYSRGQFTLFREAERRFGMNDVVEWMKYGVDAKLNADAPDRVRKVEMPASTNTVASAVAVPVRSPVSIVPLADVTLQGITWSATRPTALINGRTFLANEAGKVTVGSTNILVRCVTIHKDAVLVRVGEAGELRTLELKRQ